MAEGKQKPGVMIYFDSIRPALTRLNDEQCGSLFRAILDYAEYGVITDLEPITGMVFDLLRPKIDRDSDRYEESREQRQHAVYAREAKRRGEQPLSFSEWRVYRAATNDNGPISPDNESTGPYPSTTTATDISSTTATSLSTSSSGSSSATGEGKAGERGCKGEGEGKPEKLYVSWLEHMDKGDRQAAFAVSNELFKMGFNVDPVTKKLSKRL